MKITSRYDSSKVIYELEKETIKEVVIEAVGKDADLSDANLGGAWDYSRRLNH